MKRLGVQLAGCLQREEQQRVPLPWLHSQPSHAALRVPVRVRNLILIEIRVWEHRLAPFFHITQVHQHRRDAVTAVAVRPFMEKVVVVLSVLLSRLVAQNLKPLPLRLIDQRPFRYPSLNLRDDGIGALLEKGATAGAALVSQAAPRVIVHHTGARQPRRRLLDQVITLLVAEKAVI
eukprot:CAMPEP_0177761672 /NCGR_PEP_ID=MMETSP0491_2-20121128/5932_1 /TAXON_ID=63592 /ORGANISM="Tetraselmis chuii, Strain PLY429" /LENGTH=176 /DNA_ID=CAMNT_0019277667 /DNA_START=468 /DNA_END=998 /DNA_ORIENTATION=+